MKSKIDLLIAAASLLLVMSCAHTGDPCDDKLVSRVPSPDAGLVISVYHRECPSKIYTMAYVEKPPAGPRAQGARECRIMYWGGRHPVNAAWKDTNNIIVSTTDRMERLDFQDSAQSCGFIKIGYDVKFRNERQKTDDPVVIAKMKAALSGVRKCVNDYYKAANPNSDAVEYVDGLISKGEHRSALEVILGYASDAGCSVSPETYNLFKDLSETFDLKPEYLERVTAPKI